MKKLFLFLTVFSLLVCSCDKDEDIWIEWSGPNNNHLIAGAWTLKSLEIVECETDNQNAVDLIFGQYKSKIGGNIGFVESGYYTESGTFHEHASKYRLVGDQLWFSKERFVKIVFEDNTFYYESDYTSGFQWFLSEASFMSEYKDSSITKVIIKEVYEKINYEE
jgi:hypothetical protein